MACAPRLNSRPRFLRPRAPGPPRPPRCVPSRTSRSCFQAADAVDAGGRPKMSGEGGSALTEIKTAPYDYRCVAVAADAAEGPASAQWARNPRWTSLMMVPAGSPRKTRPGTALRAIASTSSAWSRRATRSAAASTRGRSSSCGALQACGHQLPGPAAVTLGTTQSRQCVAFRSPNDWIEKWDDARSKGIFPVGNGME